MQHLTGRKSSKVKLSECVAIIKELFDEIERLIAENEGLKKELALANESHHSLQQTVKQLQTGKDQQQRSKKTHQQLSINQKFQLTLELTHKNSQISNLQLQITTLREQLASSKRQQSRCLQQLTASKKDVALLGQRMKMQEEEKNELVKKIEDLDKYHQIEVEELKKINSIIRRNFQEMERDYDALLKLTDQESRDYHPRKQHVERRPKQPKVNIMAKKMSQTHNPQMAEQLWQIKKQVSDQMSRITTTREQAVKGRVDRTLATIQSLLIQMSHRADSDSESN